MPASLYQLLLLHAVFTWMLTGAAWVLQVVVYPQFAAVPALIFPVYHSRYAARIGRVMMPLMLAEATTAVWVLAAGPTSLAYRVSLGLLGLLWISTAFVQVPLHNRLAQCFDPAIHATLVRTNWLRTVGWTARAICLALLLR